MQASKGVILFGHGSRDPLWRLPIESVATRMRAQNPGVTVRCAYLELDTPGLAAAADGLVGEGASDITVVPMFLGTGRHAREDLPGLVAAVQQAHPGVRIVLQKAVGEDSRVVDLLAKIALE